MATTFLEPGGDATFGVFGANGFWLQTSGSPAVATDFVHGGHVNSINYLTATTTLIRTPNAVVSDAGGRVSLYLFFRVLPNATATIFSIRTANAAAVNVSLRMTSAGVLQIWNATTAQIGTDGSTLSVGIWYRISFAYTITDTTHNRFELFKNGVSDISITNATITNVTSSTFAIGNSSNNATLDFRSSDHYIDNSNSLTDTGDVWVTAKRPVSNGTSNQFTTQIGSGGSGYGSGHSPQVNERPVSTTNGWSLSNTTVQTEEYTIESKTVGDINITGSTIIDYIGWILADVDSTANSPVHHIIVGGVSTVKTMTTSPAIYTAVAGSSTYPTGNTDIGMDAAYTATPHLTSLFDCGIVVAYTPTNKSNFLMFM
jgi:hypothetical protein